MKEYEKRGEKVILWMKTRYALEKNVDATVAVVPVCQMLREVASFLKKTLLVLFSLDFDLLGQQLRLN